MKTNPENIGIPSPGRIFLTGGTGYIGRHLIPELLKQELEVFALTRRIVSPKSLAGCQIVLGDALNRNTFQAKVKEADTFVHLVGVSNPSPIKTSQFNRIDLKSVQEAVTAASETGITHFVYVSVAHPAPVMKTYWQVRRKCEEIIRESGLNATILQPWYVLGPGHRWPYTLLPIYRVLEKIPATADTCKRLGLVKLKEMIAALCFAIMTSSQGFRVIDVPGIRKLAGETSAEPEKQHLQLHSNKS